MGEDESKFKENEDFSRESDSMMAGKIAKRDHIIVQNKFHFDIKKGDDLSEIPEHFYETLKTEKII